MKVSFKDTKNKDSLHVVGVFEDQKLDKSDKIVTELKDLGFKGDKGEITFYKSDNGITAMFGLGKEKDINSEQKIAELGFALYGALAGKNYKNIDIQIKSSEKSGLNDAELAANIAFGMVMRSYKFDKYFTKKKDEDKVKLEKVSFISDNESDAEKKFKELMNIADGVFLARDLISEPPNILYPESYANICESELTKVGVKVEILDVAQMKKLGMGALLGVGQGSKNDSRMVVMQYQGSKKKEDAPIAFVGKGVTFDTGGISIKPSGGMEDMKYDMAGSATVVGLMHVLASRKAKVNAVGVIGLVENMPGGNAQRPSDVVTSMSGQTIEVLNTDAEGRLVLADALWYCQDRFKPKFMVNLATLTGAIVVSFGSLFAGLFSNDDKLSEKLIEAGEETGERLWRMPVNDDYDKQINSEIADMQNMGNDKGAGSITAAQFLKRFVNNVPWAHLDIAGVAWARKDKNLSPKGAVGFGVRLLNNLVAKHYED
jgi:leucyl aminopeptidase